MGFALLLARPSLLRRPGRTLFSILGVAVGIATVVAVFTLDHVTVLSRTWVDPNWCADLEVRAHESVSDPRAELAATSGVTGAAAFFQNEAVVRNPAAEGESAGPRSVQVVAIDAGAGSTKALGAYRVSAGRDLQPGAVRPEALVGEALARAAGLALGDALLVSQPRRAARVVCEDGSFRVIERDGPPPPFTALTVVGLLADEAVGSRAQGQVLVLDYEVGRGVFAGAFVEPRFWLKRDPAVNVEDVVASLGGRFSYELNRGKAVGQMEDERAFRNGVRMAGLLALILGLYVIFHTLSISLVERVREVAVLDALGASRAQIARVFFLEALVIALGAGASGVGLGIGLARWLLARGITTLGVVDRSIELLAVPWRLVSALALIGMALALLGSIYPLLRARNTDTVRALRGEASGAGPSLARGFRIFSAVLLVAVLPALYFLAVPAVGAADARFVGVVLAALAFTALLIGLPLVVPSIVGLACGAMARLTVRRWPLAGRLAARSIESGPSRIAVSVAAIALVTSAFVGLKGMTSSLAAEIEEWGATAVADKLFVSNLPDVDIDRAAQVLHELPDVRAVESGDARTYVPFLLIGLRGSELARTGPCAAQPELLRALREQQGMLVSGRLARHRGLSVGDPVAIQTSGHGVQVFTVRGVTDDYGYFPHPDERIYGVVDDALLQRYFCVDTHTATSLAITLQDGSAPEAAAAAILGMVSDPVDAARVRFETGRSLLDFQVADIDRDFVLFDILFGLTALLAGIGVLNGQLLAALERAQELGVLRALGTSQRQIAGTVLLESAVLGATGGAVGLFVGSALTPLAVRALELVSGLPLPQRFAGSAMVPYFAGALAVALLAGLYPIWRMSRLDPVRAVRTG